MAQTNYTPISLYYSTTAAAAPTAGNLVNGELAINITDGKLYYKDNLGVVQLLAGKGGTGIVAGSNTQVQYNNSGAFGASSNFTFNSGTNTLTVPTAIFSGTGAVTLPVGTTGQQPGTPTVGMIRYNTTTNSFEGYAGASPAWGAIGGSTATATYTRTSFTATAGQTTFTVTYTVGYVEVFLNGVLLNGTDYTATNGTTIVLATGAALNDIVETIAYNIANIGVASSLAGGIASQIPYQSSAGTTAFIPNGTSGQALISNGTSAPGFGVLGVSGGGTGVTTSTGTGSVAFSTTPVFIGMKETRVAMPASDINLSTGNYFTRTISGATTFTVSNVPTTGTANSFILDLTNGGSAAITWWSGVTWAGGTPPTLTAAGRDSLGFYTYDGGTTWTGLVLGLDIK